MSRRKDRVWVLSEVASLRARENFEDGVRWSEFLILPDQFELIESDSRWPPRRQ